MIGFRHGIRRFGGAWIREGIVSHFITALYRGDFAAGIYCSMAGYVLLDMSGS